MLKKVEKTNEEWREELEPLQYHVAREHGTEAAFTGKYYDFKGEGTYLCSCCKTPLFSSKAKFDSGTGWPSYFEPINSDVITEKSDESFGMVRTEVLCSVCDAHLGHLFPDGYGTPTGLRYCINSVSLEFQEEA